MGQPSCVSKAGEVLVGTNHYCYLSVPTTCLPSMAYASLQHLAYHLNRYLSDSCLIVLSLMSRKLHMSHIAGTPEWQSLFPGVTAPSEPVSGWAELMQQCWDHVPATRPSFSGTCVNRGRNTQAGKCRKKCPPIARGGGSGGCDTCGSPTGRGLPFGILCGYHELVCWKLSTGNKPLHAGCDSVLLATCIYSYLWEVDGAGVQVSLWHSTQACRCLEPEARRSLKHAPGKKGTMSIVTPCCACFPLSPPDVTSSLITMFTTLKSAKRAARAAAAAKGKEGAAGGGGDAAVHA
jgi:hypothetical protein